MKSDSLFYELFLHFPEALFELLNTPLPQRGLNSFTSVEVKQTQFRFDGVLLPHHRKPDLPILFLEAMNYKPQSGKGFYLELFAEIAMYLNDYRPRNDWRAVVIFTHHRLDPGLPIQYSHYQQSDRLQRLYLNQLSDEWAQRSPAVAALQLIGLKPTVAKSRAKALVQQVQHERHLPNSSAIVELIETICVYKFPDLSREQIEAMLGTTNLKQTKVYQEAKQEGALETKQESVSRFLAMGLTLQQVARGLDLPIEEVEQIVKQAQDQSQND
jgi:predicted transposase/invertase (TIGR01784 family)